MKKSMFGTTRRAMLAGGATMGLGFFIRERVRRLPPIDADPDGKIYDWGVAYYMSYDNNLSHLGLLILDRIAAGVASAPGQTVAALQADFSGDSGTERFVMRSNGIQQDHLDNEDSADEHRAVEYLRWFAESYNCRRYAVIFLDHGGTLDEMCSDDIPGTAGKRWMSGARLGSMLRELKSDLGDRWELLFLQQCGRGSAENLFSFRGTARYIMSSPVIVGAPNTYYSKTHEWLGTRPDCSGEELAEKIMQEDQHFAVYTCLRSLELEKLPSAIDELLSQFFKKKSLVQPDRFPFIYGNREKLVDLNAYFQALAQKNSVEEHSCRQFGAWLSQRLFTRVTQRKNLGLCGLSLYVPQTSRARGRYGWLDLYRQSQLAHLWDRFES